MVSTSILYFRLTAPTLKCIDPKGSEDARGCADSGSCKLSDDNEDSHDYLKGDSKKITKNEKR